MKELIMICAAAVYMDGTPDTQHMPPLVKGIYRAEFIAGGKEWFKLEFKDLLGRTRLYSFEANTCKFEADK